jgi:hypothetical protein
MADFPSPRRAAFKPGVSPPAVKMPTYLVIEKPSSSSAIIPLLTAYNPNYKQFPGEILLHTPSSLDIDLCKFLRDTEFVSPD